MYIQFTAKVGNIVQLKKKHNYGALKLMVPLQIKVS